MRQLTLAFTTAAAVLAAGALAPATASAMTFSSPAAIEAAVDATSLSQNVAYVCNRVWRCGPYGCGWRRACYWTRGPGWRYRRWHR
ncbi:MAG: hypothetical protein JO237_13170, partial [Pseudolabrys sp.]|nr:hypothetical protein [Pseudolabrys sp.]